MCRFFGFKKENENCAYLFAYCFLFFHSYFVAY
jgi:hypothetical protein